MKTFPSSEEAIEAFRKQIEERHPQDFKPIREQQNRRLIAILTGLMLVKDQLELV